MSTPITPIEGEEIDPAVPVVAGWSDAPVDGDRIDLSVSSIVAGTPGAARVELADDGLHAYDTSGAETARIIGEEGVFVGGEFRTSDALPGQVTLSDTAYVNSYDDDKDGPGDPAPGISVEPINTANLATYPGVGPYLSGIKLDGGSNTSGGWSSMAANPASAVVASNDGAGGTGHLQVSPNRGKLRAFNATGEGSVEATPALSALTTTATDGTQGMVRATPTLSQISTTGLDGKQGISQVSPIRATMATYSGNGLESGWIRAQATDAELASVSPSNVYTSRLRATTSEASMFSSAGGTNRYLTVDATGVWVKTGAKSYNLEETAQDSGWVTFTPVAGITANNTSWRNKGGIMWFRGFVTATWVSGWNLVRAGFATTEAPVFGVERPAWNAAGINYGVRMRATGDLEVYCPSAGSATIRLDGLNYPTT